MTDYREMDQELVELGLGEVHEPRRSELLSHLTTCARCRTTYDEVVAAIDLTTPAAPQAQPPAGFDLRVLAALGLGASPEHRFVRVTARRLALAAAAVVLAVIAGVAGGIALIGESEPTLEQAAGVVPLTKDDGEQVGTASIGWLHDERVMVVSVSKPAVGVSYRCKMLLAQDDPETMGRWEASSPEGGIWVVPTPKGDITGMEMVTDSGAVWASARLP
ncbi:MAG: hypothetical protein ACRDOJ_04170 [Nocardioidaceae bacterium]